MTPPIGLRLQEAMKASGAAIVWVDTAGKQNNLNPVHV